MPEGGRGAKAGATGDWEVHTSPARMPLTPPNGLALEPVSAPPHLAMSAKTAERAPSDQVAAPGLEQPSAAAGREAPDEASTPDNAVPDQSHAAGGQPAGLPDNLSAQPQNGAMTSAPSQLGDLQRAGPGALPRNKCGAGPRTRGGYSNAALSLRSQRTERARGQAETHSGSAEAGPNRLAAAAPGVDAATSTAGASGARSDAIVGRPGDRRIDTEFPAEARMQTDSLRAEVATLGQPVKWRGPSTSQTRPERESAAAASACRPICGASAKSMLEVSRAAPMVPSAPCHGPTREAHGNAPHLESMQRAYSGSFGREAQRGDGLRTRGGYKNSARRPSAEGAPRDGRPVKRARFAEGASRAPDHPEQERPASECTSSDRAKSGGGGFDRARTGNSAAGSLAAPNQEPGSHRLMPNLALPTCERCGTSLTRLCGGLGLFTCTHCGRRRSRQQALPELNGRRRPRPRPLAPAPGVRLVLQTHIPPVPPGVDLSWAARIKNEHGLEALGPLGPPSWRNRDPFMCPVSRGAPDVRGRSHPHAIIVLSSDSSDDEDEVLLDQADAAEQAFAPDVAGRAAESVWATCGRLRLPRARMRAPASPGRPAADAAPLRHTAAPDLAQQGAGQTNLPGRAAAAQMPITWKEEDDTGVSSGPEVVPEQAGAPDLVHAPARTPEDSRGPCLPPGEAPRRNLGVDPEPAHAASQQQVCLEEVEHGLDSDVELIDLAASQGEGLPSDDEEESISDLYAQWAHAPSEAALQAAAPRQPGNVADRAARPGPSAQLHAAAGEMRSPAAHRGAAAERPGRKQPRGASLPGRRPANADEPPAPRGNTGARSGRRVPKPAAKPVPARKVNPAAGRRSPTRDLGGDGATDWRPPRSTEELLQRLEALERGQQQAALAALGGLHPPDSLGGPGPPGRGRQTAAGGAPPLAPRAVLGSHRVGILGPGIYRFGSSQPSSSPSQGASPGSLRQSLPNATANAASQHRASGLLGSCVDPLWDGLHVDVRPGTMRRERSVADLHRPSQKDLCGLRQSSGQESEQRHMLVPALGPRTAACIEEGTCNDERLVSPPLPNLAEQRWSPASGGLLQEGTLPRRRGGQRKRGSMAEGLQLVLATLAADATSDQHSSPRDDSSMVSEALFGRQSGLQPRGAAAAAAADERSGAARHASMGEAAFGGRPDAQALASAAADAALSRPSGAPGSGTMVEEHLRQPGPQPSTAAGASTAAAERLDTTLRGSGMADRGSRPGADLRHDVAAVPASNAVAEPPSTAPGGNDLAERSFRGEPDMQPHSATDAAAEPQSNAPGYGSKSLPQRSFRDELDLQPRPATDAAAEFRSSAPGYGGSMAKRSFRDEADMQPRPARDAERPGGASLAAGADVAADPVLAEPVAAHIQELRQRDVGEPSSVTEAQPVGDAMACVGQLVGQLCDDSDGSGGFGEPLLDDDDTEADSDHAHSQHMGDCREAAVAADDAGSRERPPRSGRGGSDADQPGTTAVPKPQHREAAAMRRRLQEAEATGAEPARPAIAAAVGQSEPDWDSAEAAAHNQLRGADVDDMPTLEATQPVAEGRAERDQAPGDTRRRKVTFVRRAPGQEPGESTSSDGDSSSESAGEDKSAQPASRLTRAAAARQRPAAAGAPVAPSDSRSTGDCRSPEREQDAAPARRVTRATAAKRRPPVGGPEAAREDAGGASSGKEDRDARPTRRVTRTAAARQRAPALEEKSSGSEEESDGEPLPALRLPRVTHAEMEHRKIAEDAAARWTDAHATMRGCVTAPRHESQAAALEVLLITSSEEIVTFARMAHWMVECLEAAESPAEAIASALAARRGPQQAQERQPAAVAERNPPSALPPLPRGCRAGPQNLPSRSYDQRIADRHPRDLDVARVATVAATEEDEPERAARSRECAATAEAERDAHVPQLRERSAEEELPGQGEEFADMGAGLADPDDVSDAEEGSAPGGPTAAAAALPEVRVSDRCAEEALLGRNGGRPDLRSERRDSAPFGMGGAGLPPRMGLPPRSAKQQRRESAPAGLAGMGLPVRVDLPPTWPANSGVQNSAPTRLLRPPGDIKPQRSGQQHSAPAGMLGQGRRLAPWIHPEPGAAERQACRQRGELLQSSSCQSSTSGLHLAGDPSPGCSPMVAAATKASTNVLPTGPGPNCPLNPAAASALAPSADLAPAPLVVAAEAAGVGSQSAAQAAIPDAAHLPLLWDSAVAASVQPRAQKRARREVNYNETALARAAEADAAAEAERLRPPPAPGKRRLVSVLRGGAPPGAAAAAAGDDTELLRRLLPDCGVGPDGSIGFSMQRLCAAVLGTARRPGAHLNLEQCEVAMLDLFAASAKASSAPASSSAEKALAAHRSRLDVLAACLNSPHDLEHSEPASEDEAPAIARGQASAVPALAYRTRARSKNKKGVGSPLAARKQAQWGPPPEMAPLPGGTGALPKSATSADPESGAELGLAAEPSLAKAPVLAGAPDLAVEPDLAEAPDLQASGAVPKPAAAAARDVSFPRLARQPASVGARQPSHAVHNSAGASTEAVARHDQAPPKTVGLSEGPAGAAGREAAFKTRVRRSAVVTRKRLGGQKAASNPAGAAAEQALSVPAPDSLPEVYAEATKRVVAGRNASAIQPLDVTPQSSGSTEFTSARSGSASAGEVGPPLPDQATAELAVAPDQASAELAAAPDQAPPAAAVTAAPEQVVASAHATADPTRSSASSGRSGEGAAVEEAMASGVAGGTYLQSYATSAALGEPFEVPDALAVQAGFRSILSNLKRQVRYQQSI